MSDGPLRARYISYDTLPGKYQDVMHRVPDTSKAERVLGFRTQIGLDDGLERTIDWHRAQRLLAVEAARG
jgi:UDP-glucose 4-epimerase